jgi:transcriptional regulator with XRE-family HTH domain
MPHLPTNLQLLRRLAKRSQDDVAHAVGVTRSSYSGYETGVAEPRLATLVALRNYHKIDLDTLIAVDMRTLPVYKIEEMQRATI